MCKIRFNVNATDSDGNIVAIEGRYRKVGQILWNTYTVTNLNLPETPDITDEGDYEHQVRVQDNDGAWNPNGFVSSPNFKIGNCTANQLPVANAGVDRTIQLPTTSLSLNGSSSNDPDGTISSFSWVVNAGTLSDPNVSTPVWSGLNNVGTYTATLTVTDNDGGVSSDTMTVTVQAATVYLNTQQSQAFTKNDCGNGSTGSTVTYVVPAGTYSSTVSQAAADNLALNDINDNGQNYANSQGTCTNVAPTITGVTYPNGNCCEPASQSGSAYVSSPVISSGACNRTVQFTITGAPNEVVNYNLTFSPVAGRNQSNVAITLNSSGEGVVSTNIGSGASAQTNGSDEVTLDVLNTSSSFDSATASMSFTNCGV